MHTKEEIGGALLVAISDHRTHAGACTDWAFVELLKEARELVFAAPERTVPYIPTPTEAMK